MKKQYRIQTTLSLIFLILLATSGTLIGETAEYQKDYRIKPVLFTKVGFNDHFWAPKIETNRKVSIPSAFGKCEETGRIDNFAIAGKLKPGEFKGDYPFDDTDVYKVLEGASYALAVSYDPKLDAYLDNVIKLIGAAQEKDGYLYTCRTSNCTRKNIIRWMGKERWERLNSHELYNCGHMYEAAVAHYQATGKKTLLDIACKNADLVATVFGPNPGQKHAPSGHPIIEMALVKLYRVTGKQKYLQLAQYFIDETGRGTDGHELSPYSQDHKPIVQQKEAVGHAVRFGYLYSGITDVAALTGNKDYIATLHNVWENILQKKLYITGGIGARSMGEGFGENYELPNMTAYCETCASISYVYWNYRMFLLTGSAKYIDVLERTLYNGLIAGVSADGKHFFYDNPLESDGEHQRQEWFGCACCPGNVTRFIASIPGYQYAVGEDGIYVNLFAAGNAEITVKDTKLTIEQQSNYPWDGKINITVHTPRPTAFKWYIRIPGWTRNQVVPSNLYTFKKKLPSIVTLKVNRNDAEMSEKDGFAVLSGTWKDGDTIQLNFPMPVRRIETLPVVKNNVNKVSLQRGPLVYCLEAIDNRNDFLFDYILPDDAEIAETFEKDLLDGIVTLSFKGKKAIRQNGTIHETPVQVKAIPYYAWNNRGKNRMLIWIPRTSGAATPNPQPSIASTSKATASTPWVSGLNDGFDPLHSKDTDKQLFYWWLKKGTREWVQYTFEKPVSVSQVQVYWMQFDHYDYICRPPSGWEVQYKDGDQWVPVKAETPYTTELDRYNTVQFSPVTTSALRLSVQLQKDVSAGILEWKVF